jgi:predicted PurR-regulated permease PerM
MHEMKFERPAELTRAVLQLAALGALIGVSLLIIKPFLGPILWAATGAVATWPILLRVQTWLGGKRAPAIMLMTAVFLLTLMAPFYVAVATITDNAEQIVKWSKSLTTLTPPGPPAWVRSIPLVGSSLVTGWQQLLVSGPEQITARIPALAHAVALWFLSQVGNVGLLLGQFVLTIIFIGVLYANGEMAHRATEAFARRLAGAEGEKAVVLATQAVRGVASGVVLTAIVQSLLAGVGLGVAGVPFAAMLTTATFMLSIAQIGPLPVLIGAVIWVYDKNSAAWAIGLLLWTIFCTTTDNLLRPFLIRRSSNIPLILIFLGVLGGLIAFGVIGLFIGPTVLAVGHALLVDWISESEPVQGFQPESAVSSSDVQT